MRNTATIPCLVASLVAAFTVAPAAQSRITPVPAASSSATRMPPAAAADDRQLPPAVPVTGEYRVGPGDKLNIVVYRDTQLSGPVQIRPDGKITIPLIGDMDATGKTPIELRDAIAVALKEYVTSPVVTVVVVEALSSQVTVMGEVAKPGAVPISGPTSILQALALAGGFKDFANTKDIRVIRPTTKGIQTLHFNYRDAVNGDAVPLMLRAGDTIVVR